MPRSTKTSPFPARVARPAKAQSGKTVAADTPLNLRAFGVEVDKPTRERIRNRFGRKLGKFATHIERASVRVFEGDGAGDEELACRVKVVMSGHPSVVADASAASASAAFDRALDSAARAVRKELGRSGARTPRVASRAAPQPAAPAPRAAKTNVKKRVSGMTSALETSDKARPSRKSTRGSVNRATRDQQQRVRAVSKARAPKRQATKASASRAAR